MSATISNAPDRPAGPTGPAVDADDVASWLRLSETPGLGAVGLRRLLAAFGLPGAVFAAGRAALARQVPDVLVAALTSPPSPELEALIEKTLIWAGRPNNHFLTLADPSYPAALLTITDPPPILYVTGDPALLDTPQIAIVGSRHATSQGMDNARRFATALAEQGLVITSGLALGIDGAAHEGALQAPDGHTLAVIGTGADVVYPARHRGLAHRIAARGALVSEFPLGTPARPHHFPRRNRIIAGLAQGIVVVEAAAQSGSLITARLAADQGREVFAIPGSIHAPLSKGCHRLIKQGAKLVESAADILEELRLAPANPDNRHQIDRHSPDHHSGTQTTTVDDAVPDPILLALGHDPAGLDTLQQRLGCPPEHLSARLLELELSGQVERLPGDRYQRSARLSTTRQ